METHELAQLLVRLIVNNEADLPELETLEVMEQLPDGFVLRDRLSGRIYELRLRERERPFTSRSVPG